MNGWGKEMRAKWVGLQSLVGGTSEAGRELGGQWAGYSHALGVAG